MKELKDVSICVIGLGYVGLPLAALFSQKYKTIGYDINETRVSELKNGLDSTQEVSTDELKKAESLAFTSNKDEIRGYDVYVVTVPTPIDINRQPDLSPLISASKLLGEVINKDAVVIYESTVYPGATEEDCIPVIEKVSGLTFNKDFYAGYSPERINPGDKSRPVHKIVKVTSGSTPEVAKFVDGLYGSVIEAGTHLASTIRVAEASKVIENTQRDVNIALVNELSVIFDNLNIDTAEVIEAAATKWNFVKLFPGLVGGHCIGVDPYYLLHKSMSTGYVPDIIRTSREINDGMAQHFATSFVKKLIDSDVKVKNSKIIVLGFTFKENCPDVRNTKVADLVKELSTYNMQIDVFDPWVSESDKAKISGVNFVNELEKEKYDGVFVAVNHKEFSNLELTDFTSDNAPVFRIRKS
ncbi:nucleotide sugar dehydrogenase [Alteromonas sp. ALT199]|uniref:nucleotide sugar dehydrogenase n=1 Tax=unclassified Alteromonas TaxID=2614992 RepID=UPI001BE8225E|nr:nucleotide sugar dehydrogenase [Alteromonas sp. ALT199]MBT3136478.1 nucleotide sugar dehydrogenase [Alteromonas sp. ALT199]